MAVVINGSGTVTGLAVGGLPDGTVDAGTLATDSVTAVKIPDTVEADLKSGRKNLIINGGFDVWQRGTSFTGASGYTADRITHTNFGGASPTVTKVAGTGGFRNAIRYTNINGGASQQIEIEQRIEGLNLPQSGNLTLSYWVRGSRADTVRTGRIINGNTGTTNTGTDYINVTTAWQKVSITVTTVAATESQYYRLFLFDDVLSYFSDASVWLEFTGVQLELGSTTTDFEHRSYGEELALCERYFCTSYNDNQVIGSADVSTHFVTSPDGYSLSPGVRFPRKMRTNTPTVKIYSTDGTINNIREWNTANDAVSAGHLHQEGFLVVQVNSTNPNQYYAFHYTADAEL